MKNGGNNIFVCLVSMMVVLCCANIGAGHRMFCVRNTPTNQGLDHLLQAGNGANYYHYNYVTSQAIPGKPETIKKCYIRFAINGDIQLAPVSQQAYQQAVNEKKSLLSAPQLIINQKHGYYIIFSPSKQQLRDALFMQQQKTAQDIAGMLVGTYKEYSGVGEILQQAKEFLGPQPF